MVTAAKAKELAEADADDAKETKRLRKNAQNRAYRAHVKAGQVVKKRKRKIIKSRKGKTNNCSRVHF